MEVTFTANIYCPAAVRARYVRANIKNADELPDDIRAAADALRGTWPAYVDWPLCGPLGAPTGAAWST